MKDYIESRISDGFVVMLRRIPAYGAAVSYRYSCSEEFMMENIDRARYDH